MPEQIGIFETSSIEELPILFLFCSELEARPTACSEEVAELGFKLRSA